MSFRDIALQGDGAASPAVEDVPVPFQVRANASPGTLPKRSIPKGHPFDPKSLKPLVQTLWSLSVSLGHVLTAHRQFSRLKSVSFSPDGMIGGRGYVLPIKDVRRMLHEASESISVICDTLFDEINAPHWKPKLGELEKNDDDFVKLLEDAKGYMDDPEGEAEEDMDEVEARPLPKRIEKSETPGSMMPDGGAKENDPKGSSRQGAKKLSSRDFFAVYPYANASWNSVDSYDRRGNSSVRPAELPGPRVEHLDRAEEDMGGFQERPHVREYDYPSGWDNDTSGRVGESSLPADTETRTEGFDFGVGYGNGNDAHGQGAGGYANPDSSGKGVYGPRAELPDSPPMHVPGTGTEGIEHAVSASGDFRARYQTWLKRMTRWGQAKLPNDETPPVSRSDTYAGPKGNDFAGVSRYSESGLPGDGSAHGTFNYDRNLPNVGYLSEQVSQPYVKWDAITHNMRPDFIYQRDTEGPYVKQSGEGTSHG